MNTDVITGNEEVVGDGGPLDALVSFYRAFNHGDLESLANNWASGDRPSMNNPLGGMRRGWSSIHEGYTRLFSGPARVRVELYDITSDGGADHHMFVGRERGTCFAPSGNLALRIRTTRWFVRIDGVWRQLHHHGSIEEPHLLAEYQRAILGAPIGTPP